MHYQCEDCSYSRQGVFPNGRCPACGSMAISRRADDRSGPEQKPGEPRRWRLVVSVILWVVLACLIYEKI